MAEKSFNFFDKIDYHQLIQSFCLFDDLYMSAFFADNIEGMEQVLRIIMDKPDLKVISLATQAFAANLINHSARFDVVAQDAHGKLIDIEVQRSNSGASRKRARFYSSMLDYRSLDKCEDYDSLPETWVIFITEHDVIGKNKPIYLFERTLIGDGESFGDDSHILYVNGACRNDTPLGKLMHDFACTNADQMYYNRLAERTRYFKESKEGEPTMNEVLEQFKAQVERNALEKYKAQIESKSLERGRELGKAEGIELGKAEGLELGLDNTLKAIGLIQAGKYALEEIASLSGLSVENVKAIQAKISATV